MKSIFLLNERVTKSSPSQFFDLLEKQSNKYKFHRLYLSSLTPVKSKTNWKSLIKNLIIPQRIQKINALINKYKCFMIFSTGIVSDFWTAFFIKGPKRVCFIRGHLPEVYSYRFNYFKIGYVLGLFHYFIATNFDQIVVMTTSMQLELEKITGIKAHILYNYADPPFNYEDLNRIKSSRVTNNVLDIGIVGSLLKAKGIEDAIIGFSEAIKLIPNIRLCIYGSGPERDYFENFSSKHLPIESYKFYGYLNNKQDIYKNMVILIHSSHTEGTSRAVLEALSSHVIVLHRDIKGANELIIPGYNGYLFQNRKTISNLICHSIELSKIIQNTDADIEYLLPKNFTHVEFSARLNTLIEKIV